MVKKSAKGSSQKEVQDVEKPASGFHEGDIVKIKTDKDEFEGTVIPSFDSNIILLKLGSGYNLGIEKSKVNSIKKIGAKKSEAFPEAKSKSKKSDKPGISIIITGGTISSRLDYNTGAVTPLISPDQLFFLAPKLLETVKINKIERPFTLLSENMHPEKWKEIAKIAAELLNKKENKGIIITHGTDTLHYTAAALSFMLKNVNKPVVLTYSQKSTDRGSTDAVLNLTCSGFMTLSDVAEVMLVGHASQDDDKCYAMHATKVRKMHTSRRDAFRPINDVALAEIDSEGKIKTNKEYNKRDYSKKVIADTAFEDKIAFIKAYPGADPKILDYYVNEGYRGIVIEATGLGHVSLEGKYSWIPHIKDAIKKGMIICFAPQTIYGRLDPYIYSTGRELLEAGVIFLEDILPETAYIKLGWVLGHEKDPKKVKEMMLTNIANEFNPKISEDSFLY